MVNADHDRKLITIKFTDNSTKLFNLSQSKPYLTSAQHAQCYTLKLSKAIRPYSSSKDNNPRIGVNLTEVLCREDERCKSPKMTQAIKSEIKGLLERGIFKVILTEEVPPEANTLPVRFVL